MAIKSFVRESNRIEGILRDPTQAELDEAERFMRLDKLTLSDLEHFARVYQPDAVLRSQPGWNVYIGNHVPPQGGPEVVAKTEGLIQMANERTMSAYELHHRYETLHPFTDCNGRSGRMIWRWMMQYEDEWMMGLGFLHAFYYQSLAGGR